MTPEETSVLLAYAQTLDSRIRQTDEQAKYQISAWSKILDEVPPLFARAQVDRFYRAGTPAQALGPGDIRGAWRIAQRTEAAKDNSVSVLPASLSSRSPEWFRTHLVAVANVAEWKRRRALGTGRVWDDARAAAHEAIAVLEPPTVREPEFHELRRDERQRDCGTTGCPCPHQECRGGFLDAETQTGAVRRCTWCAEAVEMSRELAPKRKGRR